jgi:hypothetical protein
MIQKRKIWGALAVCAPLAMVAVGCGGGSGGTANDPLPGPTTNFVAINGPSQLVRFSSNTPFTLSGSLSVTGLQGGEPLLAIDVRPANGQLYALGSTGRLYTVNTTTGAATLVGAGPITPAITGTAVGFDFNPVVDRIRIVTDTGQNLRVNPDTGDVVDADPGTAGTQFDGPLNYAAGDRNVGATAQGVGAAYTNSRAGAADTTLFVIDANTNTLAIQNPPNNGTLNSVGATPLGFDVNTAIGFDIAADNAPDANAAFIVSNQGGNFGLFRINTATGATTRLSNVGNGALDLRGLAIIP